MLRRGGPGCVLGGCACGGCACPLAALDARAVMSPRGCRPPVALSLCSVPVEFPAVLLNAATGRIEAEFHTFVQPQEQPVLSEFCTTLTGVTQVSRCDLHVRCSFKEAKTAKPPADRSLY